MRRVCASGDLAGGRSVRFPLVRPVHGPFGPLPGEGFVLRAIDGAVRAYVNLCPHRAQPVDLGDGRLLAVDGTLLCQAHGAHFLPEDGRCVRGPCPGRSLTPLAVEERAGEVFVREEEEPVDDP